MVWADGLGISPVTERTIEQELADPEGAEKTADEKYKRLVDSVSPDVVKISLKNSDAPQASVSPNDGAALRYPVDPPITADGDFMYFQFYDYKPPFQRNRVPGADVLNQDIRQYNQTGYSSEFFQADKSVYPQIVMYMPQDIQDAFKATWQGKKFGAITAGILASAGQSGVADKVKGLVSTGERTIKTAGVNAAAELISGLAKNLTGDSISAGDIFGGISGVARNPNMELLFQNMNVRTFDLSFKMAPYSQEDADSMEAIISIFKRAMLPQYALNGSPVFGQKNNKLLTEHL